MPMEAGPAPMPPDRARGAGAALAPPGSPLRPGSPAGRLCRACGAAPGVGAPLGMRLAAAAGHHERLEHPRGHAGAPNLYRLRSSPWSPALGRHPSGGAVLRGALLARECPRAARVAPCVRRGLRQARPA